MAKLAIAMYVVIHHLNTLPVFFVFRQGGRAFVFTFPNIHDCTEYLGI